MDLDLYSEPSLRGLRSLRVGLTRDKKSPGFGTADVRQKRKGAVSLSQLLERKGSAGNCKLISFFLIAVWNISQAEEFGLSQKSGCLGSQSA